MATGGLKMLTMEIISAEDEYLSCCCDEQCYFKAWTNRKSNRNRIVTTL
jgi:hypothetical protein